MSRERVRGIVAVLEAASWNERPTPLRIGDLVFDEIAALLEGPGAEHQLVVVLDPAVRDPLRLVRALVRGLERTGSTRPVTLVVVAGDDAVPRDDLARLCRTVVVRPGSGSDDGPDGLQGALRSLVPLDLPEPLAPVGPVDAALSEALSERRDDPVCRALIDASRESADAVEAVLHATLDAALAPLGLDADQAEDPS